MSWLSKKWDQLSGKNQKVGLGTINKEYDAAFKGARDAYGNLQDTGEQMMDADSQLNLNRKAQMEASAADSAAEGARQAQRLAAMGGGGNTASLTAQTMASGNQAQAGAIGAFNNYLQGAMGQGAGLVSQSANNMAQMNQTQMNAVSNQRLANARLDSQATGMGASMLGSVLGNVVAPGIGGKIGAGIGKMFAQDGGPVDEGLIKSIIKDEMDSKGKNKQSSLGYSKGFEADEHYNPDYHELWDYQEATGPKTGKDMIYTRSKDGKLVKQYTKHYGGLLSGVRNFADRLRGPQEVDELPEGWSPAEMDKEESNLMQDGGYIESPYGNKGGMLSQVMGPDGIPMNVRTRIGGQYVG